MQEKKGRIDNEIKEFEHEFKDKMIRYEEEEKDIFMVMGEMTVKTPSETRKLVYTIILEVNKKTSERSYYLHFDSDTKEHTDLKGYHSLRIFENENKQQSGKLDDAFVP